MIPYPQAGLPRSVLALVWRNFAEASQHPSTGQSTILRRLTPHTCKAMTPEPRTPPTFSAKHGIPTRSQTAVRRTAGAIVLCERLAEFEMLQLEADNVPVTSCPTSSASSSSSSCTLSRSSTLGECIKVTVRMSMYKRTLHSPR